MAQVGFPDLIAFLLFFSLTLSGVPSQSLMYISAGIQEYSVSNISYVMECYHQHHKNQSCKDIDLKLQNAISSLQIWINVFKGILGPVCALILGGLADILGKKAPILYIVALSNIWSLFILINCVFPHKIPLFYYLIQDGLINGLCGGSTWTINTFNIAYISTITHHQQRAARIGTLIAIGFMGTLLGPLISGVILQYSELYIIPGIGSSVLSIIALLITIFCLKNVHNAEVHEHLNALDSTVDKFWLVIRYQFDTLRDVCQRREILPRLVGSVVMYLLTVVGMATPLLFVITVYIRGAPFNWTNSQIAFLAAGTILVLAIQSALTLRTLQWFKFSRPVIARTGIFFGFIGSFFLAFASEQLSPILGMCSRVLVGLKHDSGV